MTTTTTIPRRTKYWSFVLWACLIYLLASSDSLLDLILNAGMAACFISGNYRWRWQGIDGSVTNLLYALGASFLLAHYMRDGSVAWTAIAGILVGGLAAFTIDTYREEHR